MNEHLYDRGGMPRVHLRGRINILKRLVVHAGAANLGLLMRNIFGVGTPRGQQSRVQAAFSIITAVKRVLRPHRRPSMREYGWFLRRFLPHALTLRVPVPA